MRYRLRRKIPAVNEIKDSKCKRVSSSVAYGYKKIERNKERWYIDEMAAEMYAKFLNHAFQENPSQIARQSERKKILTPIAYYNSVVRKASNPMPTNIYG